MDRRTFIKRAGLLTGAAATGGSAFAAPAIAQAMPDLEWRLTSSYPKALANLYQVAEDFARWVSDATDGRFRITIHPVGEIAGTFEALDATRTGEAEMCQTASYYYVDKDPAFAFGTTIPFGLNSRQQNAWMYYGGGIDLLNRFYETYGVYGLPAGNTGAQMGGWFRREVNTVDDLKDLKMRIPGLGAVVLAKLGVVPQQLSGGDAQAKLASGEIDAAEWVGPYDDLTLGFQKAAKYYYYPGWWDGGPSVHHFINLDKWNALPKAYQAVIVAASAYANSVMQARYDVVSPAALRRLVAEGAQLRPFSQEILAASFKATAEVLAEKSAESQSFRSILEGYKAFQKDEVSWFQVAEGSFDAFLAAEDRAGGL